jgi:hypothetical protein
LNFDPRDITSLSFQIGLLFLAADSGRIGSTREDQAVKGWLERWGNRHPRLSRLRASDLCCRDVPPTSNWQVIGWWEARRVPYNLIVGTAGILSSIVIGIVGLGAFVFLHTEIPAPAEIPAPSGLTVIAVIFYAIIANLFFTGGWLTELAVRKAWPEQADRFATLSFSLGLIFSVLLTLLPGILAGALGFFGLLAQLFRVVSRHSG